MTSTKKCLTHLLVFFLLPLSGCSNVFKGPSPKNSDEAYFEEAQKSMDTQDWDSALANMNNLSAEFKTRPAVIEAWAGAYAGKCGLDFISYFGTLGSASLTGSTFFKFLMNAFTGRAISPAYCTLAQTKMEEISTDPLVRTSGQNLFMAVLGMVKIGVFLKKNADTNDDGIPDPAFNVCTGMSAADTNEVLTGLGLITTNLVYLTAALAAGSITGALTDVNTACSASPGACGKTSAASVSVADRDLILDILKTDPTNPVVALGIGNCVNPLVTSCCP